MSFAIVGRAFASVFKVTSFVTGIIQHSWFQSFQILLLCLDVDRGLTDVVVDLDHNFNFCLMCFIYDFKKSNYSITTDKLR